MKLEKLFDFQKFMHNETLDQMIEETEARYGTALSDDELSLVSAAGPLTDLQQLMPKPESEKKK